MCVTRCVHESLVKTWVCTAVGGLSRVLCGRAGNRFQKESILRFWGIVNWESIPKFEIDPIKRNRHLIESIFQFNNAYLLVPLKWKAASYKGCTHINSSVRDHQNLRIQPSIWEAPFASLLLDKNIITSCEIKDNSFLYIKYQFNFLYLYYSSPHAR